MIIQEDVIITVTSNQTFDSMEYWTEKGYTNLRPGTGQKLKVKVSELPKFSGAKVLFKCDGCGIEWERRYSKKFTKGPLYSEDFCHKCSRLSVGKAVGRDNAIKGGKKNCGPAHHNWNPNKKEFQAYAYKVRRLSEKVYEKNKHLLNPDDLPRTLCGIDEGYQLDHKMSIKKAFDLGMSEHITASINNLQLLPWVENRTKSHK